MNKKISKIVFVLIFLVGLSLLLYPYVSQKWNTYRDSKLITSYEQVIQEKEKQINYSAEWERARAYNKALFEKNDPDAFKNAEKAETPDEEYLSCLDLAGDGMMGFIEIPKISVKLSLYHTIDESVLEKSVGHLEGSSLPVGGENTHAVVSAHRGLPGARLFTDLDQLQEGEHFLLHILDEVLCYEIDQILVVEPTEIDALLPVEGQDYVTLFTCTPYGVNSHRLLVRGHRVEYVEEVVQEEEPAMIETTAASARWEVVLLGLAIVAVSVAGMIIKEKNMKKQKTEDSPKE